MDHKGRPDRTHLSALIGSAATSSSPHPGALDRLVGRCWPAGGDRIEPGALAWVLGWGPNRTVASVPACTCAAGRCGTCN
ncbi:MAG: hypothetical protein HZB46_07250 [Solirubrobacterales bacterium]|nr:hypothetical protein [Solirubrobacterales bacterium]